MMANGTVHVKWYRKESSKIIILHAKCAHPIAMKHAIVRHMFKTATSVCSGISERTESLKMANEITAINGYPPRLRTSRRRSAVNASNENSNKIPLCLPFISERISSAIKECLRQAQLENDVRLVNIPNRNIKQQLVRNRLYDRACTSPNCVVCPYRALSDCVKSGVVYRMECMYTMPSISVRPAVCLE